MNGLNNCTGSTAFLDLCTTLDHAMRIWTCRCCRFVDSYHRPWTHTCHLLWMVWVTALVPLQFRTYYVPLYHAMRIWTCMQSCRFVDSFYGPWTHTHWSFLTGDLYHIVTPVQDSCHVHVYRVFPVLEISNFSWGATLLLTLGVEEQLCQVEVQFSCAFLQGFKVNQGCLKQSENVGSICSLHVRLDMNKNV